MHGPPATQNWDPNTLECARVRDAAVWLHGKAEAAAKTRVFGRLTLGCRTAPPKPGFCLACSSLGRVRPVAGEEDQNLREGGLQGEDLHRDHSIEHPLGGWVEHNIYVTSCLPRKVSKTNIYTKLI